VIGNVMEYPLRIGHSEAIGPFFILQYSPEEIYMWEEIDMGTGEEVGYWMRWPNDWDLLPTHETNLLTFLVITGRTFESTLHLLKRKKK